MSGKKSADSEQAAPDRAAHGAVSEILIDAPLDPSLGSALAVGIDSGATLVKVCVLDMEKKLHFTTWRSPARDTALELLERLAPKRIGLTGCGSADIAAELARDATTPLEFDAWGRGANTLLAEMGSSTDQPYLLVSIGTGTSILHVDGELVERLGGTALGGGAALGLGLALTGCRSHDEFARLAARGQRGGVDLLISDIYDVGTIPIAAEATAASFGKLAHSLTHEGGPPPPPKQQDLAAATMGLVAENIALLCNAYARMAGVKKIVYGGSTLADNPALVETVRVLTTVFGFEAVVLKRSGHAGALGAMLLSR